MNPAVIALNAVRAVADFIYPSACLVCASPEMRPDASSLCRDCMEKVIHPPKNACSVCARPLDFEYEIDAGESYLCGVCTLRPPVYEQLRYALIYAGPVRELVHLFKFGGRPGLHAHLARLGEARLVPWMMEWSDAVVIPTPLHSWKLFRRGFNPAYLVAASLAKKAGLEVVEGAIRRVKSTKPQFGLSKTERAENVKGAFAVKDAKAIKGKRVIVFDDIFTTGATMSECAKTVLRAKPLAVRAATLFRTGLRLKPWRRRYPMVNFQR